MIPYFKTESGILYYGDAIETPTRIKPNSVHCVVTSPPYWGKVDYMPDEPNQLGLEKTPELYIENLVKIFREVRIAMHDSGTLWLNTGDTNCVPSTKRETVLGMKPGVPHKNRILIPYKLVIALQEDGWWVRCTIIWYKRNAQRRAVKDRPTYEHEYIFLLTKKANYFYDHVAVFQPLLAGNYYAGNRRLLPEESGGLSKDPKNNKKAKLGGRNLGSVWDIPTKGITDPHYAAFPHDLAKRCIDAGTSKEGCCEVCKAPYKRIYERESEDEAPVTLGWEPDCKCNAKKIPCTVFDPFMGRGTVAMEAEKMGRHWIGIEKNDKSCELIKQNLNTRKYGLLPPTEPREGFFPPEDLDIEVK